MDDIAFINSMHTSHSNHYNATLGMHTGSFTVSRPSIGAWVSYGLGTENQNLPSFMVLAPQSPYAGGQVWGSDFLPGAHQGTRVQPGASPVPNITRGCRAPCRSWSWPPCAGAMRGISKRARRIQSWPPVCARLKRRLACRWPCPRRLNSRRKPTPPTRYTD